MIKSVILALLAAVVVFVVAGPILYHVRTTPQRAATSGLAQESEAEIRRVSADAKSFSRQDYLATMDRIRERDRRYRQILAEKGRIRTQSWLIAIPSGLGAGALVFGTLLWRSKKRLTSNPATAPPNPPG